MQKHLPVVLSVDAHTQDLGVELLGAPYVSDVQHEMVDPGGLYHLSALLGSPDPASPGIYAARGAKSTRKRMALDTRGRSEEHTSELQSRLHLVCRLLLEKKKKT